MSIPKQSFPEKFQLIRPIGEGGTAKIYLVFDKERGIQVALKELSLDSRMMDRDRALKRFKREFLIMSELSHPNIVSAFDFIDAGDKVFIAMEYIEGYSLSALEASTDHRLNGEETLNVLKDIAAALSFAHQHGVVHRDLKPANVMIDLKGRAKLLDFGIASLKLESQKLTRTGEAIGTPYFMAPEQFQNAEIDARTDIYSFGVLTFFLFSGQYPFKGENYFEVSKSHLRDNPPPLHTAAPNAPNFINLLVTICLEKKPKDRYQSLADILALLEKECGTSVHAGEGILSQLVARVKGLLRA